MVMQVALIPDILRKIRRRFCGKGLKASKNFRSFARGMESENVCREEMRMSNHLFCGLYDFSNIFLNFGLTTIQPFIALVDPGVPAVQ